MQVLFCRSAPGFTLVLVLAQELLFQSLLKIKIPEKMLEDLMVNAFILKKKRLDSF